MTVIVQDGFSGTTGTMAGRTPDTVNTPGNTWTVVSGTWSVNGSNQATKTADASTVQHVTYDAANANCTVDGDVYTTVSTEYIGLTVRFADAGNLVYLQLQTSTNKFYLTERVSGANTHRASADVTVDPSIWYALHAVCNGSTITATLDAANEISYASFADTTSTKYGLWVFGASNLFDNFILDDGGAGSHALTATGLTTTAPTLAKPALAQIHPLTATGLTTTTPKLAKPAAAHVHVLTATGLTTTTPKLAKPALTQAHALTASALITPAPTLAAPALVQVHALIATALTTTAPTLAQGLIRAVGLTFAQQVRSPKAEASVTVETRGQIPGAPMVNWGELVANTGQATWWATASVGLADGSILRFVSTAATIVQDAVANPTTAAGWAAAVRTTVDSGVGAYSIAVVRVTTTIRLWYISNADGNVYYRESTDDGDTWTAATAVYTGTDAYQDLVAAYISDGSVSNGPWFFGFSAYAAGNYTPRFGYYNGAAWVTHAYSVNWRAAGIDSHASPATRHRVFVYRQQTFGASRIRSLDKLADAYSNASDIDQTQAGLFGLIIAWARYVDIGPVTMGVVGETGYQDRCYLGVSGVFEADEVVSDEPVILPSHLCSDSAPYASLCAAGDDLYVIGDVGVWRGVLMTAPTWTLTPIAYTYDDHECEMKLAATATGLVPGHILVLTRTLSFDNESGSDTIRLYVIAVERATNEVLVRAVDAMGFLGNARCRRPCIINDGTVYADTAAQRLAARVGIVASSDTTTLATAAVMPLTLMPMEGLAGAAFRLGSQSEWYLVPANDGTFALTIIIPGDSDSGDYDDSPITYGIPPLQHTPWRAAEIADWRTLAFSYVLGTYSTDPEDGSVVAMADGPWLAGTRPISYSLTNMRYNTSARVAAAATAEAARQVSLAITGRLDMNADLTLEVMHVVSVTAAAIGWNAAQYRVRRIQERWEPGRLTMRVWLGDV